MVMMNNGVTIPIAASASAPSPLTHIASAMLLIMVSNREIIIGMLNPITLFFGSFNNASISMVQAPSVEHILNLWNDSI